MEKLNTQLSHLSPHTCPSGIAEPKTVAKPKPRLISSTRPVSNKVDQKPWSVFEGIYWI